MGKRRWRQCLESVYVYDLPHSIIIFHRVFNSSLARLTWVAVGYCINCIIIVVVLFIFNLYCSLLAACFIFGAIKHHQPTFCLLCRIAGSYTNLQCWRYAPESALQLGCRGWAQSDHKPRRSMDELTRSVGSLAELRMDCWLSFEVEIVMSSYCCLLPYLLFVCSSSTTLDTRKLSDYSAFGKLFFALYFRRKFSSLRH